MAQHDKITGYNKISEKSFGDNTQPEVAEHVADTCRTICESHVALITIAGVAETARAELEASESVDDPLLVEPSEIIAWWGVN
jgi:hypothetical protein